MGEPTRLLSSCQNWFCSSFGGIGVFVYVVTLIGLPSPGGWVMAVIWSAG